MPDIEEFEKKNPQLCFKAEKELRAWLTPKCKSYTAKLYKTIDDYESFNIQYDLFRSNRIRVGTWILWYPESHKGEEASANDVTQKFGSLVPADQLQSIIDEWFGN